MKAILPCVKEVILIILAFTFSLTIYAQPEYSFKNSTLFAGTNLQPGAIYLFTNVKPGVDARIEIKSIIGGIAINNIDGTSTGFSDAFQPFINVLPNANGYIEFELRFYTAGTSTLMNQSYVPMTPIDIDGQTYDDGVLYETDQIELKSGYYNYSMSTSELAVGKISNWVWGRNTSGWSYPGIDTTATSVMFTVVNGGVNTIRFRVGAQNSSPTESELRLRSVYFKNFAYPNGLLPENLITDFKGNAFGNQVKLAYEISEPEKVKSVVIERSGNEMDFKSIGEKNAFGSQKRYDFIDEQPSGLSFYRLKLILQNDNILYSNILRFESSTVATEAFKVFPTLVNDQITVQLKNTLEAFATLQIFDFNGRMVRSQQVRLQKGIQNFTISNLTNLSNGNYIVVAKAGTQQFQQKIMIQ
jgi:hypothetical protein